MLRSVGILGSGIAGLHIANSLLELHNKRSKSRLNDFKLKIDLFEKNSVPGGLVLTAVMPDNKSIRNVIPRELTQLKSHLNDKIASLRFYGDCEVGKAVSFQTLSTSYDALAITAGTESTPRDSQKPYNDSLQKIYSEVLCNSLLRAYNGNEEFDTDRKTALSFLHSSAGGKVTLIGAGNVTLEVLKILLSTETFTAIKHKLPLDWQSAFNKLHNNPPTQIVVLIRRGLLDAKWSLAALRDLFNSAKINLHILNPIQTAENGSKCQRMVDLLTEKVQNSTLIHTKLILIDRTELKSVDFTKSQCLLELKSTPDDPSRTQTIQSDIVVDCTGYSKNPLIWVPNLTKLSQRNHCFVTKAGWSAHGRGTVSETIFDAKTAADRLYAYLSNCTSIQLRRGLNGNCSFDHILNSMKRIYL